MPIARTLSVVYDTGGSATTIGGASTTLLLDGEYTLATGPDGSTFSCVFVLRSTTDTDAAFNTLKAATETALRTPRKRLRIILGAETLEDWNPASGINTGYNQDPDLVKVGDEGTDGPRTQRYLFSVNFDQPADLYSQAKRRDSTVTVSFTPSRRRTLTVSGEYRSEGGVDSARAAYEAGVTTYVGTLTSALGGTWELAGEPNVSANDTDTICSFSITYEEIRYEQSGDGLDHPTIVQPQMKSRVVKSHPGDSVDVSRMVEVMIDFECSVNDWTVDLNSLYASTIRPWIWANALKAHGASGGAVLEETAGYDRDQNKIFANMRGIVTTGSGTVEYRRTVDIFIDHGVVMIPVWTGDGFSRYVYSGVETMRRTTTETSLSVGTAKAKKVAKSKPGGAGGGIGVSIDFGDGKDSGVLGAKHAFSAGLDAGFVGAFAKGKAEAVAEGADKPKDFKSAGGSGAWYLLTTSTSTTPIKRGDPSIGQLSFTELRVVTVEEWAVPEGSPVRSERKKKGTAAEFKGSGKGFTPK